MIEQEGIADIVLCVALEVEDEAELVVDLALLFQLLEPVARPLPELREPDSRDKNPATGACTALNQLDRVFLAHLAQLLVRVVKLLAQAVLDEVELRNCRMLV